MRALIRDLVARCGGEASEREGALAIALPEEGDGGALAERLGRRELLLVFEPSELGPDRELVAPGSHVLRAIEEFLARRGRRAYVVRPAEARLTRKALGDRVRAAEGFTLRLAGREARAGFDVYVVYRLRYRSREREDALETVRVRLRHSAAAEVALADPPDEAAGWDARPRKRLPDELHAAAFALADAEIERRARVEGARRREDARGAFHKDLSRLHAYYSGQIAEYQRRGRRTDLSLLRVEELEEERELRIRELLESTNVRVEAEPIQLLVVEVPLQTARLELLPDGRSAGEAPGAAPSPSPARDGEAGADAQVADAAEEGAPLAPGVELLFDRSDGSWSLEPCVACAGPLAPAVLAPCGAGHVVHEGCLTACERCGTAACGACGERRCPSCERALCPGCGGSCPGCGETACPEHLGVCARCDASGCEGCLARCAHCEATVCARDRTAVGGGSRAVLCSGCAVACPGCRQATVATQLVRCAACGRRFCQQCHPRDASACALCRGAAD